MDPVYPSRLLRPVKASQPAHDLDFDASLIDRVIGTPDKIAIPERYIPEQEELEPEEEEKRTQKAERICRLLSKSNLPSLLVLPTPPKVKGQGIREEVKGRVPVNGHLPNTSSSLPSSPARVRLFSQKRQASGGQVSGQRSRGGRAGSCDWSLAGVLPPTP